MTCQVSFAPRVRKRMASETVDERILAWKVILESWRAETKRRKSTAVSKEYPRITFLQMMTLSERKLAKMSGC